MCVSYIYKCVRLCADCVLDPLPIGFGGGVQVFSVSTWGPEATEQRALFQHRGHSVLPLGGSGSVRTTSHAWHPDRPRTLLSAATDGSVHVWDWVHPRSAQD